MLYSIVYLVYSYQFFRVYYIVSLVFFVLIEVIGKGIQNFLMEAQSMSDSPEFKNLTIKEIIIYEFNL